MKTHLRLSFNGTNLWCTQGELMGLRWKDIDWSSNTVFVLRTKNGDAKEMSIIPKLKDYLFKLWDSVKLSTNDINVKDHFIFRGTVDFPRFSRHNIMSKLKWENQRVTVLVKELTPPWFNSTPFGDDQFAPDVLVTSLTLWLSSD